MDYFNISILHTFYWTVKVKFNNYQDTFPQSSTAKISSLQHSALFYQNLRCYKLACFLIDALTQVCFIHNPFYIA